MPTLRLRGAAVLAASALTSLAATLPATADTRHFEDKAHDTGTRADITTVRVTNGGKHDRVKVVARVGSLTINDYFTFWFDTRRKNRGPEYKVDVYPNSDGITLMRVGSFRDKGKPVHCPDLRATADAYGPNRVSVSIPRKCLHYPGKVRVSLRGRYVYDHERVVDWAPGKHKFFGWVAR